VDQENQRLKHQLASCQSRLSKTAKRHERYRFRVEQRTEELSRAKRVFETTLEALPSGILVIDHEMNVFLMNNALRSMFGVKEERVTGRKCYSVMLNSSFPCKGVSCRRVIQNETPITEELVIFVEGDKRLFEVRTLPWRSEGSHGVVRTFTDVTLVRMANQYRILAGISSYMAHTVRNALMPMAVAALKQLLEWDVENISETLAAFTETIALRATELGLNVAPANERASHLMGIHFLEGVPKELLGNLAERKVYVSVRGNSVRVSPHLYNTNNDVDRLFDALSAVL